MEKSKLTLVILAAGLGTRYGGLKQMDTVTTEGYSIIDFSLYDALQAGFKRIVFVIRKSFEKEFKKIYNEKLKSKAEVIYVCQELDGVPEPFIDPKRTKPWGTGHALLMAKKVVKGNFAVINADDFYGHQAFKVMAKALRLKKKNSYEFFSMAYQLKNTISEFGSVSRGECHVDEAGFLMDVIERSSIEKKQDKLKYRDEGRALQSIDENTIVSMNFWGFTPKIFEFGDELLFRFLKNNKSNHEAEFFLPHMVNDILKSGHATVEVLKSDAKWLGVTYQKDKLKVQKAIEQLQNRGVYPKNLWPND